MTKTIRTLSLIATLSAALLATACVEADVDGDEIGNSAEEVSARPSFDLFKGADGRYYFHLEAANREIILQSQGYTGRTNALAGILSVLDNGGLAERYDLRQAKNGQWYFNLKAANHKVIGTSEMYDSKQGAQRGIAANINATDDYLGFLATRSDQRFVIFEGHDGRYFFHLRAANGEIVLQSQAYASEASAFNGAFAVAQYGTDEANYDINEAANGGFYFNLKATNGEVIGTSEVYTTKFNAERACESVVELLPTVDLL